MKQVFLNIGDEVASYRIESFVARGGMAMVYRARDIRLDRSVALKLLAPELSQNENFRQRFMRESRLAAACDHPNIIPIYEAGETDDRLFIAMRYVEGFDLRALLDRDGPLEFDRAMDLFFQVGLALDAAHGHGLVHRDVKPGNILVASGAGRDDTDHVYLTDFGLTKRSMSLTGYTTAGHFLGTIDYIAPEQIAGKAVDARADIYALACVLYEALASVPPFQRDNDAALLWAHLSEPPPRLTLRRPDLAEEVDNVFAQALAKEPGDRFSTCRDFLSALLRPLADSTVGINQHRPPSASATPSMEDSLTADQEQEGLQSLTAPPTVQVRATGGRSQVSASSRSPAVRWLRLFVPAAVIAFAVVAAVFLLRPDGDSLSSTFTSTAVGVSFKYPGGWGSRDEGVDIVLSARVADAEALFVQNDWAGIRAALNTAPEGTSGLYTSYNTSLADPVGLEDILQEQLLPRRVTTLTSLPAGINVGGLPAREYEGNLMDPDSGGTGLHFQIYVVPSKSAQFTFFAPLDRFNEQRKLFMRVIRTVQFR